MLSLARVSAATQGQLTTYVSTAQREIAQLHGLLSDHGLVWLGTARSTQSASDRQAASEASDSHESAHSCAGAADNVSRTAAAHSAASASSMEDCAQALPNMGVSDPACGSAGCASLSPAAKPQHLSAQLHSPAWVAECYQRLQQHIQELDAHMHTGVYKLHSAGTGTSPAGVQLAVWQNGLQLHQLPFMPWVSRSCSAILRDIFEGVHCCKVPALLTPLHAKCGTSSKLRARCLELFHQSTCIRWTHLFILV